VQGIASADTTYYQWIDLGLRHRFSFLGLAASLTHQVMLPQGYGSTRAETLGSLSYSLDRNNTFRASYELTSYGWLPDYGQAIEDRIDVGLGYEQTFSQYHQLHISCFFERRQVLSEGSTLPPTESIRLGVSYTYRF
jgi:hypothetical protein